jgi:cell division protein FtsI (penicillin-binding protein 3)
MLDNGSEWFYPSVENNVLSFASMSVKEGVVPNVQGMGMRDAVLAMEQAGYKVKIRGYGHVSAQSIPAGTAVKRGSLIVIQLQ